MMETLLRDEQRPKTSFEAVTTVHMVADIMCTWSIPGCQVSPTLLAACTSLAATLGKVLDTLTHTATSIPSRPSTSGPTTQSSRRDVELAFPYLARTHHLMCNAIFALPEDGVTHEPPCDMCSEKPQSLVYTTASMSPRPLHSRLLQLKLVMGMTLLRLSTWTRRNVTQSGLLSKLGKDIKTQENELSDIVQILVLPGIGDARAVDDRAFRGASGKCLLEGYAVHCVDGRPQPGCCNTRCTKLVGPSEAALPTKLCSGCWKVRYCSVECQKMGWTFGHHGILCGKSWEHLLHRSTSGTLV